MNDEFDWEKSKALFDGEEIYLGGKTLMIGSVKSDPNSNYVILSSTIGNDSNDGKTSETAVYSIARALEMLKKGELL